MKDRVPTYPGRRKMIPVEGQPNVYDVEMADVPTQEGTPLNTETLFQNSTAASLGLGDDATPDDGFKAIIQLLTQLSGLITYGTTDLTAGTSNLATGVLYVVYE